MAPNGSMGDREISGDVRAERRGRLVFAAVGIMLVLYLVAFRIVKDTYEGQYAKEIADMLDSLTLNMRIHIVGVLWWFFEPVTSFLTGYSMVKQCLGRLVSDRGMRGPPLLDRDDVSSSSSRSALSSLRQVCVEKWRGLVVGSAIVFFICTSEIEGTPPILERFAAVVVLVVVVLFARLSHFLPVTEPLENNSTRNYLMYLQVNVYIFATLSIVNGIINSFAEHPVSMFSGVIPDAIGGGGDGEVFAKGLSLQVFRWVIDGIVMLLFFQLMRACTQHTVLNEHQCNKIARTVWLQAIPVKDRQTGEGFSLDREHFKEVAFALARSLDEQVSGRGQIAWTDAERDDAIEELTHRGYVISPPKGADRVRNGPNLVGSKVERCQVVPVLDEWERVQLKYQRAQEKVEIGKSKIEKSDRHLDSPATTAFGRCMRCRKRVGKDVLTRKQRKLEQEVEALQTSLERLRGYPKRLSGSAFVTFHQPEDCDKILAHHCLNMRNCNFGSVLRMLRDLIIRPSGYSYFKFGRPPFNSVTLRCSAAPPPSDIEWKNLHVPETRSQVYAGILGFFLLGLLFLFLIPLMMAVWVPTDILDDIKSDAASLKNWTNSHNVTLNDDTKKTINEVIDFLDSPLVLSLFKQLPTIMFTIIFTGILPFVIEAIGLVGKARLKSSFEVGQKNMNAAFIIFNAVLMPISGMTLLEVGRSMLAKGILTNMLKEKARQIPTLLTQSKPISDVGPYAMKYLMNAAFLSSIIQLLNIGQITGKFFGGLFAKTESERQENEAPYPFPWGYWYGYSLSIFTLTTVVGCFTPSVYPMAAVFFYIKFSVDRYNLVNNVYDPATEMGGRLVIHAVRDMRYVVAFCWIVQGVVLFLSEVQDWVSRDSLEERIAKATGIILIVMGAFVYLYSTLSFGHQVMSLSTRRFGDRDVGLLALLWRFICASCTSSVPDRILRTSRGTHGRKTNFALLLGLPTLSRQDDESEKRDLHWDGAEILKLSGKMMHDSFL